MLLALLLAMSPPADAPVNLTLQAAKAAAQAHRDPFEAYDATPDVGDGPLQVALHRLKLEGVVAGTASPRALIQTPDGKSHVARVGDPIGTRWGRIAAIKAGRVEIKEAYRDPLTGAIRYDITTLRTR
jgi:Tfp pilus assembly protein PilP